MDRTAASVEALAKHVGSTVTLQGWLHNKRASKDLLFLELRDGSGIVQCVMSRREVEEPSWAAASQATQESALWLRGLVVAHARQIGGVEVHVAQAELISLAEEFPITPKAHGVEFLMDRRHLWLRSRRQWAVLRIRNRVTMSIHEFYQERGFVQMDAPILTGNAVEGTSTLFEIDYFGSPAYLTQSGQLHGEVMAMAFGKIYTFGPTFRAEKSKTRRHLTEFWMIEPEMAFYDLEMNMDLAEDFVVRMVDDVLRGCKVELAILGRDAAPLERVKGPFPRLTYTEAVDLLRSDKTRDLLQQRSDLLRKERGGLEVEQAQIKKQYGQVKQWKRRRMDARRIDINQRLDGIEEELRNIPSWASSARDFEWGRDFGGSDETLLTWHFDRPIIIHRYPAPVKAFYMKRDPEDDRLALGMDVLAPEGYGEVIGGGERATDLAFLQRQVDDHGLPREAFEWYLDLRRYGSVPHAGFGLGLERMVSWICHLDHIRETIPFPRLIGRLSP